MAMSNEACIRELEGMLRQEEDLEAFLLETEDEYAADPEDIKSCERCIEALRRAIRALEGKKK